MKSCVDVETIEDLLLGKVTGAQANQLRAHLEICDACALAALAFEEERELFVRRAETLGPPPPLVLPVAARVGSVAHAARRAFGSHASQALAAAAALLLASGVVRLGADARTAPAPVAVGAADGAMTIALVSSVADEGRAASEAPLETLACSADLSSSACLTSSSASTSKREPTMTVAEAALPRSACEAEDGPMSRAHAAICELAVTSSTSRQ